MTWLIFVLGAILSWGLYGVALHTGQVQLANPLRALLCVGVAYFLIGVLVPVVVLSSQGELSGFNAAGATWATGAGALGAIGAVCIIWAFRTGGIPLYVMPLVFGGAPLVNVIGLDDAASTQGGAAPTGVRGLRAGGRWSGTGAVLQTAGLGRGSNSPSVPQWRTGTSRCEGRSGRPRWRPN